MTIWSVLAALAAGQGLFLAIVLTWKKKNQPANRLLASFLLLLSFTLFNWVLWWTGAINDLPAFKGSGFCIPLLYGPLMLFYYQTTFENKKLDAGMFWHFLPALFAIFLFLPFYLRFFENIQSALLWIPPLARKPWFPILIFVQMIGYGLWIAGRYRKYFLENNELWRWHRWMLAAYGGIVLAYIFYRLLSVLGLKGAGWIYLIAGSMTLFIYLVAWLGYIEPRIFSGEKFHAALNPVKYHKSSLTTELSIAIYREIMLLLEKDKIYRLENFSLKKLAKDIGQPQHHISQAINEQSGMTLPQLINKLRVEDAQRLLTEKSKEEMNVSEVAFYVGFNTKKAFNLAFKDITGMTPTMFRKQINDESAA